MRKDISKLICEKPRSRSKDSYKTERHTKENTQRLGFNSWPFDGESASPFPFKEGIKKKFGKKFAYKGLNDSLGAVEGFLRKSVGRKWAEVYSELSKNIPKTKYLNQHVWEHIMQDVETHAAFVDGRVCVSDEVKRKYVPIEEYYKWGWRDRPQYYVHPVSNILLVVDRSIAKKKEQEEAKKKEEDVYNHMRLVSKNKNEEFWAVKIKQDWFGVTAKPRPQAEKRLTRDPISGAEVEYFATPAVLEWSLKGAKHIPRIVGQHDHFMGGKKFNRRYDYISTTGTTHYVAEKRQLSHRELKKYKLI
jgi:hypothetical protein